MNNAPAIQLARFPDGGFVLHKITAPEYSGRFSAWFDASGGLLDAEQITTRGSGIMGQTASRHVKRDTPSWSMLAQVGKRYVAS
jgi:hypothetical protein